MAVAAALLAASAPLAAVTWPHDPDSDVIGQPAHDVIREGDTLVTMARMHDLGHWDIRRANPEVDVWLPRPGTRIFIPQQYVLPDAPREGIVVNLAETRLYFFPDERLPDTDGPMVVTHPIGIGILERATPTGSTRVTHKLDDPAWYPTDQVRAFYAAEGRTLPRMVPPGPDNPLGEHAIILERKGYLIHGTHRPAGVGMRVSQGCIRLYPESIRSLIRQVPVGTPVHIVDQRIKAGFHGGQIFVEVHPPADREAPSDTDAARRELERRVESLIRRHGDAVHGQVDEQLLAAALARADGVATVVTRAGAGAVAEAAGR